MERSGGGGGGGGGGAVVPTYGSLSHVQGVSFTAVGNTTAVMGCLGGVTRFLCGKTVMLNAAI